MPLEIPIRAVAGALPLGVPYTPQALSEAILERASFFWDGAVGFQNGGTMPTSDVGPYLLGGTEWRFWNTVTGTYDLTVFQSGDIKMVGGAVNEATGWLLCDGRQFATSNYPALFGAIGYGFLIDSDKSGGLPINPEQFRLPNFQGRSPLGTGSGTALTTRILGEMLGAEAVTLVEQNIAQHDHPSGVAIKSTAHDEMVVYQTTAEGIPGNATIGLNVLNSSGVSAQPLTGQNQVSAATAHANMHPSLVVSFAIKT